MAQAETKAFLVAVLRTFRFAFTPETRAHSTNLAKYPTLGKNIEGPAIKLGRRKTRLLQLRESAEILFASWARCDAIQWRHAV